MEQQLVRVTFGALRYRNCRAGPARVGRIGLVFGRRRCLVAHLQLAQALGQQLVLGFVPGSIVAVVVLLSSGFGLCPTMTRVLFARRAVRLFGWIRCADLSEIRLAGGSTECWRWRPLDR